MKVWIATAQKDANNLTGKGLFCNRLANELGELGVDVTSDINEKVDIALNVIRITNRNGRANVLRLDGVYHNTKQDYKQKNQSMIESVKEADGVIYQSCFAKHMADTFLVPTTKPNAIIYNGSYPELYQNRINPYPDNPYAVAVSRWRPHKRLQDILESWLLACDKLPDNAKLIVAGDTSKSGMCERELQTYFDDSRIEYVGVLDQTAMRDLLSFAKCNIHLCWFDACPNSVIESICAGVPVITNNVGGTSELVLHAGGYVLDIDKAYDYTPIDLYSPPPIENDQVAAAVWECFNYTQTVYPNAFHINLAAKAYLRFFEEILA